MHLSKTTSKNGSTTNSHDCYSLHDQKNAMHENGKMSLSKGFTDDWKIHLQADELEELEAVHVGLGHGDVADHQVELVPVLPLP